MRPTDTAVTLTIRNVEPAVKDRLHIRAARNRRSLDAELRAIICAAAWEEPQDDVNLAEAIRQRMAPLGGVDLPPFPDTAAQDPPVLDL